MYIYIYNLKPAKMAHHSDISIRAILFERFKLKNKSISSLIYNWMVFFGGGVCICVESQFLII